MTTWYEDGQGGRVEELGTLTTHGRLALFGPFSDEAAPADAQLVPPTGIRAWWRWLLAMWRRGRGP